MRKSPQGSFAVVMTVMTALLAVGFVIVHMLYNMTYASDSLVMLREAIYTQVHGTMSEKYRWYFQTYPHNMGLEVLWIYILNLTGTWKAVEVTGSLMVVLAILFASLTVRNVTHSAWASVLTFGIAAFYVGTCYHSLMPYTHNYGILFPVLCLYVYTGRLGFYKKCFLLIVIAAVGSEIKMTTVIPFIAIAMTESVRWLRSRNIRYAIYAVAVSAMCFGTMSILRQSLWENVGYKEDKTLAVTLPYFLAMGQCTETVGHFDNYCYSLNKMRRGTPRKETDRMFCRLACRRVAERGLGGNLAFWGKKISRTWGDASMLDHGRSFSNPIMKVIGVGYTATRQMLMWAFYILIICALPVMLKKRYGIVVCLSLAGVFLYQLLFEAQSHYIYMFSPLLVLAACVSVVWVKERY